MKLRLYRTQRGMTLIEIAITLVIVSILLAVGISSYADFIASSKIRAAGEGIQNGLRLALTEAIKRNRPVDFLISTDTAPSATSTAAADGVLDNLGYLIRETPLAAGGTPTFITSVPPQDMPKKVQILRGQNGQGTLRISPLGRVSVVSPAVPASEYYFGIKNSDAVTGARKLCVVVSSVGRVRMCDKRYSETTDPQGCAAAACPGL